MKRFISALALCVLLLVLLVLFLFPPPPVAAAKQDVLSKLLSLPAPPPPNPLVKVGRYNRDEKFYEKNNPPKGDAPIDEILEYWRHRNEKFQVMRYSPEPSEKVRELIIKEIEKDPKLVNRYLKILGRNPKTVDLVKDIYDRQNAGEDFDRNERRSLREWLKYNSPYFSTELVRTASGVADSNEYVTNQDELLALARVDFDKAQPIIDRLYGDRSLKTSRVVALWALYRQALETNSIGDIDRYRDELKEVVEDKTAIAGMRDLAMDVLASEKEWAGRDEWYFSLLGDESLADLKVNGTSYTGLTTLILVSPDDKYVEKMLELLDSNDKFVSGAAIRNLVTRLESGGPEVIKALLPWLEDPKWAADSNDSRATLVRKLSEYQIPESVPGLIKVLNETHTERTPMYSSANTAANAAMAAANAMAAAANAMANAANSIKGSVKNGQPVISYPYRSSAIAALAKQKDGRAVPALRRVISEVVAWERSSVVRAILECGGFTVVEQMAALEAAAKRSIDVAAIAAADAALAAVRAAANGYLSPYANKMPPRTIKEPEISDLLGQQLMQSEEISDELARAIVARIEELDGKDARLAAAYRAMILRWQNAAINILLLRDVKRDAADTDTIVRLLSQRRELRDKQAADVFDLQTGKPIAVGIAACLLEDANDYVTLLEKADAETKTAMLACARLIRASLPVAKVGENLKSPNQLLQIAAERYLESEDSPEARSLVLARHANEAKILGATSAFYVKGADFEYSDYLWKLYQSIGDDSLYNGWGESGNEGELEAVEKGLQEEVKKDDDLVGVYAYDSNYIRIYKDRVIYRWDEDDSRYRERPLTKYEFEEIKAYLTANNVDELPPFLTCGGDYCSAKELVMLGRNGGRRVYMSSGYYEGSSGNSIPDFFAGLDKYFADLRLTRATLKYGLSHVIPGLEILLASDDLHAETVWHEGSDLRVAATDVSARKKIEAEIENSDPDGDLANDEGTSNENERKKTALREKRRYEGFAWYKVADGGTAGVAAQPPQVEFIPLRDALTVQPTDEQWKARAGGVEMRASNQGLFKVVRGRLTTLHKGNYQRVVITPNGRWAVASKFDPQKGSVIFRIDLATNREYPIQIEGYGQRFPAAYVPTLNKVLVVNSNRYDYHGEYRPEEEDAAPPDAQPSFMLLLDPASSVTQPIAGEFRPLSQQTFRPLQKASKPNEFWVAMHDPKKNETQVGIYNTNFFGFKPILNIPKINFNSMSMWVDETAGKVYFVYRGHLLALPLGK